MTPAQKEFTELVLSQRDLSPEVVGAVGLLMNQKLEHEQFADLISGLLRAPQVSPQQGELKVGGILDNIGRSR